MNVARKSFALVLLAVVPTACGIVSNPHLNLATNNERGNASFRETPERAPVLSRQFAGRTIHQWAAIDLSDEALRNLGFRTVDINRSTPELHTEWRPLARATSPTSRPECDDGLSTAMRVHVFSDRGTGEFYVDADIRQSASAPADSRAARELYDDVTDAIADAVRQSAERPDTLTAVVAKATEGPREPDGRDTRCGVRRR